MTTMTVVTVLIREKSLICVMDESWFGCAHFWSVARKHACTALSVYLVQDTCHLSLGHPGPGAGRVPLARVGRSRTSFLPPTGDPLFCLHFQEVT